MRYKHYAYALGPMKTNACLRLVARALIRFYFRHRPTGGYDILNGLNRYLH